MDSAEQCILLHFQGRLADKELASLAAVLFGMEGVRRIARGQKLRNVMLVDYDPSRLSLHTIEAACGAGGDGQRAMAAACGAGGDGQRAMAAACGVGGDGQRAMAAACGVGGDGQRAFEATCGVRGGRLLVLSVYRRRSIVLPAADASVDVTRSRLMPAAQREPSAREFETILQ